MKDKNLTNMIIGICIILVFIFVHITRGFTAARTIFMMIIIFVLPVYLILSAFQIEKDEALFYAFFISLGLFSYIVYFVSYIFNSLKISLIITTIVLYLIGGLLYLVKKKAKNKEI